MHDVPLTNSSGLRELISFRIGTQEFCVDITSVREIRGWTDTTPMPHAPDFVRGVINLRGTVMPVVDLACRLGLGRTEPTPRHVIIVAFICGQLVGLLVDAVCETLTIDGAEIQTTPDIGSEIVKVFVKGLINIEGRMVTLIALDHVLPVAESAVEAA